MLKVDTASFQLVQYSFGGATVRMFSELLAHGDADERAATPPDSMSPFFAGGMEKRLHSIVTLASPMNGTTAYDMFEDPGFDPAGAPSKPLDRENIERGLWNIFPAVDGDHMWLQGGLLHKHDIRPFYLDLLTMISRTARHPSEIE
jgi:hypothetical protein